MNSNPATRCRQCYEPVKPFLERLFQNAGIEIIDYRLYRREIQVVLKTIFTPEFFVGDKTGAVTGKLRELNFSMLAETLSGGFLLHHTSSLHRMKAIDRVRNSFLLSWPCYCAILMSRSEMVRGCDRKGEWLVFTGYTALILAVAIILSCKPGLITTSCVVLI
ncbi:hypothetical protein SAMN04487996_101324 [Dyadobacter soli]|uniref:Uncharacterized protein n=1 Tax=Dyadobacter soli TaxID=659014 RepID=A0A1G6VRR6_9BACT|nr:hypothetical protein SAMN04487996_101324 [Dyadobacter soli]